MRACVILESNASSSMALSASLLEAHLCLAAQAAEKLPAQQVAASMAASVIRFGTLAMGMEEELSAPSDGPAGQHEEGRLLEQRK